MLLLHTEYTFVGPVHFLFFSPLLILHAGAYVCLKGHFQLHKWCGNLCRRGHLYILKVQRHCFSGVEGL